MKIKRISIGITGASGAIYAFRLIKELIKREYFLNIIFTENGLKVFKYELEISDLAVDKWLLNSLNSDYFKILNNDDLFVDIASGSSVSDTLIIIPASMGTVARIANGFSTSLIERVSDVIIKEKKNLIVVPREAPLSSIHLKNLLTLSENGATVLPAMPGFYHKPKSLEEIVDFIVGKILDNLNITNNLYTRWQQ